MLKDIEAAVVKRLLCISVETRILIIQKIGSMGATEASEHSLKLKMTNFGTSPGIKRNCPTKVAVLISYNEVVPLNLG